jgi:hypothetical protein
MTEARWAAEVRKMNGIFPWFRTVQHGEVVGFKGFLRISPGTRYSVEILACKRTYPAAPPKIWVFPALGSNRLTDGSLCIQRAWRPDCDTFAQQVMYAAAYIAYQLKLAGTRS